MPLRARPLRLMKNGVTVALLAGVLAACGGSNPVPQLAGDEPDTFLYERGVAALEETDWFVARERFRQLVDGYPQSRFRADAKLGIGDSYMGQASTEAYPLAVAEFREFLSFFPTHARADYAQQQIGEAYFRQMRGPERDQTATRQAIQEFETFVERYPNSSLLADVQAHLREAQDRLSESEFRVGLFYYRVRWYPGAIERFKAVLETNPEYSGRDTVYFHLGEALIKSDRSDEALPYFERLITEFEVSDHLDDAWQRVSELDPSSKEGDLRPDATGPAAPAVSAR